MELKSATGWWVSDMIKSGLWFRFLKFSSLSSFGISSILRLAFFHVCKLLWLCKTLEEEICGPEFQAEDFNVRLTRPPRNQFQWSGNTIHARKVT